MARLGLYVVFAACTGLIGCQNAGTTNKPGLTTVSPVAQDPTTQGPVVQNPTTQGPVVQNPTTSTIVETKPAVIESNIPVETIANLASNVIVGEVTDSAEVGSVDLSSTDVKMSGSAVADMKDSFVIPSNEINVSGNSGSNSAATTGDTGSMTGNAVTGNVVEDNKKGDTTTNPQTNTAAVSTSTEQTMTKPASNTGTMAPTTASATEPAGMTNSPDVASTSAVNEVTDSTQGTVAPTVTNVGQTTSDSGTIVFKSGNSKATGIVTTAQLVNTDAAVNEKGSTTPTVVKTSNVMSPTTASTTQMLQTGSPTTSPVATEIKINNDAILTNQEASGTNEASNIASVEVKSVDETSAPSTQSPIAADANIQGMTNTINVASTNEKASNTNMVETIDNDTTNQSVSDAADASSSDVQTDSPAVTESPAGTESPVVACTSLMCINTCKYGREVDERGCQTCKCKFSPDCPAPQPTTRLLCLMQLRLGQKCSSDLDCPVQRICCPGYCGQSCRRRSGGQSQVLAILRKF